MKEKSINISSNYCLFLVQIKASTPTVHQVEMALLFGLLTSSSEAESVPFQECSAHPSHFSLLLKVEAKRLAETERV